MIITNQNDFALTEIDLSCTNWTRDGPVPMSVPVRDVIGPGSINYVDRYVGLVDSSVGIECRVERVPHPAPVQHVAQGTRPNRGGDHGLQFVARAVEGVRLFDPGEYLP